MVDKKIEEIYQTALILGLKNAAAIEKEIFKNALYQIAVCAIDEVRSDIGKNMHDLSNKYTNGSRNNN